MTAPRLSEATLGDLLPGVRPPHRPRPAIGILHLGLGAFHRGHMAVYTEDALAEAPGDWGICGVSMRSPEMRERLQPQQGLYTLVERGASGARARIVGSVREVLTAPEAPGEVVARIASPAIRIVSLTVTEKGYALDPGTRRLRLDDPAVAQDLRDLSAPRSTVGLLVAGFATRRARGLGGVTALSCDNLPSNGRTLRRAVLDFAEARDEALARWIAGTIAFPDSMVDRIVPATTGEDRALAERLTGLSDAAPVMVEPFTQWVVEDRFAAGRPEWERSGASFVEDVAPYELMKLRLLNASHSAIAYLGALAGLAHVSDVVADGAFRGFVEGLMAEAAETVPLDTVSYRKALLERFGNPALAHKCRQIAMDGSQKLPQRLLGTVRDRLAEDAPIPHLAAAVAAWLRYLAGVDEAGERYAIDDPFAERLAELQSGRPPADRLAALLRFEPVFGRDLPQDPRFVGPVSDACDVLWRQGARALASGRPPA